MNGWLLDTDVLSAFAPGRHTMPLEAAAWFDDRTEALYLSAITAAEIEAGSPGFFEPGPSVGQVLSVRGSTGSSLFTPIAYCPSISQQQGLPARSATPPAGIPALPMSRSLRSPRRANSSWSL